MISDTAASPAPQKQVYTLRCANALEETRTKLETVSWLSCAGPRGPRGWRWRERFIGVSTTIGHRSSTSCGVAFRTIRGLFGDELRAMESLMQRFPGRKTREINGISVCDPNSDDAAKQALATTGTGKMTGKQKLHVVHTKLCRSSFGLDSYNTSSQNWCNPRQSNTQLTSLGLWMSASDSSLLPDSKATSSRAFFSSRSFVASCFVQLLRKET